MGFIASGQHVGKQGGQATRDSDGEVVCIAEQTVINVAPFEAITDAVRRARDVAIADRFKRRTNKDLPRSAFVEATVVPLPMIFNPKTHKIVEARKYEQDMADLNLLRERMGQMIEDELAALSDFEDFDDTPAVHMVAGADGIFRPNT